MARKRDSWTNMLSCSVCLEDYEENGIHIPILLPCSHTLCESCVKQTIRNKTLVCPVCRKKHRAGREEQSFSKNKYLLLHIQSRKHERCEQHGMELILFCFEESCHKPICISCLVDHNKHDVQRIETKEKDLLKKELKRVKNNLETKMQIICEAKKLVAQNMDKCIQKLETRRENVVKYFDKLITEAKNQGNKSDLKADNIVSQIKENIDLLSNIEEKVDVEEYTDCEVKSYHETVKEMIENNKKNLSGARSFHFPVFYANRSIVSTEMTTNQITSEKFLAVIPDEDIEAGETRNQLLPTRFNAFQLKCTGT